MKVNLPKKIKRFADLVRIAQKLKKEGKKIVLCHGVFDLIHPGHIRHFSSAKKSGDVLVVTITADKFVNKGPGRPVFSQNLRAEVLSAIELIDYLAIVNFDSAVEPIRKIKPHFYVKGPDYKDRIKNSKIPRKLGDEEKEVQSAGGKLLFTDDQVIYSSSKLIGDYLDVYPPKTKRYLDLLKSKYTPEDIVSSLSSLGDLKILIVGDAIIDQYHYCLPMGKSSKEPVMVHQYISDESFIGGSLATANHCAALSNNITLLTVLGKEKSFRNFITKRLKPAVEPVFFYQTKASTIVKRRFLDVNNKQKLFQISYLKEDFLLPEKAERQIIKYLDSEIKKYHLVIVNDFGHGLLTEKIIRLLSRKANFLALNVQANSANYGFNIVTKYPKAHFVCIDDQEIRLATHDKRSDLEGLLKKIFRKMKCRFMIVTKGPYGSISYSQKTGIYETPALTERVVDRVGAGDALFAITSPCVCAGMEEYIVSFAGNVAGALQVQTVGNKKQIEFGDIVRFINRLLK